MMGGKVKVPPPSCACVPNFGNIPDSHGVIQTLAYVTSEGISSHTRIYGSARINELAIAIIDQWDQFELRVPGVLEGILINWDTDTEFAIYKHPEYGFTIEWNRCPERNVEFADSEGATSVGWSFHSALDIISWAQMQFEIHHPGMLN